MTHHPALPLPPASPFDLDCIAPPRVFAGEDAAGYEALLARVRTTLQPRDVLEEIWTRDIVDLVWEIFRLRRMKTEFMNEATGDGLGIVLDKRRQLLGRHPHPEQTVQDWLSGDRTARETVEKVLTASGLTMDAVGARTLAFHIWDFERIDHMTQMAEARRDSALREIERHRAGFGRLLRLALARAEEAEQAEDTEIQPLAPAAAEGAP
jgi:hypothetical protein